LLEVNNTNEITIFNRWRVVITSILISSTVMLNGNSFKKLSNITLFLIQLTQQ